MSADDELRNRISTRWGVDSSFTLDDVYSAFERDFESLYPDNTEIRPKLRQLLQVLRDEGTIEFVDNRGNYRRLQ